MRCLIDITALQNRCDLPARPAEHTRTGNCRPLWPDGAKTRPRCAPCQIPDEEVRNIPIYYSIHPDRGLAYFRLRGPIPVKECVDTFLAYADDPLFDPGHVFLTESRSRAHIDTNFVGIVTAVQRTMLFIRSFPIETLSVIHAPVDRSFGLARILQQVMEPVSNFHFHITRLEADALAHARQPETSFSALEDALNLRADAT
jgi:hypothetical protein